jgi:hypothetical protein
MYKGCGETDGGGPSDSLSNQPRMERQIQIMLPDRLEDGKMRLHLLRHRVHVAEAALERVGFKDRRGARRMIRGIDNLLGLM